MGSDRNSYSLLEGLGSGTAIWKTVQYTKLHTLLWSEIYSLQYYPNESKVSLVVKGPTFQCRRCKRVEFDPGSGRSPTEGNGNPFQFSCLKNVTDRGYSLWVCKELDMTEELTNESETSVYMKPCARMFVTFLFIISQTWKQP